jgi:hypothetical protein
VLGLLLALAACRDAATQTVVAIDAEDAFKAAAPHLAINVSSLNGDDQRALTPEASELPIKLVLAPKSDDAKRRFALDLIATNDAGAIVLHVSLSSGFVGGASRYVSIDLQASCLAAGACTQDACTTFQFDPNQLGSSEQSARVLNVDCQVHSPSEPATPSPPAPGSSMDAGPNNVMASPGGAAAPGPVVPLQPSAAGAAAGSGSPDLTDGGTHGISPCGNGYMLVDSNCVSVDQCTPNPCGDNGSCVNGDGGYKCNCSMGYHSNSVTCVDTNECQTDNGGCQGPCVDLPGGKQCQCPDDSWLQPDGTSCAKFTPAVKLSSTQSTIRTEPQIAFDGDGTGVAVWLQSDGTTSSLWTASYKPGMGWKPATKLPTTSTESLDAPCLALDGNGHGLLLWVQTETMRPNLWSASYAAGSFGAATRVETDDTFDVSEPAVALDVNGNGYAIWTYSTGAHREIWGNRWRAGGLGWAGARNIAGSGTLTATTGRLAFDGNGYGNLVWTQYEMTDGSYTLPSAWSARYDPLLGWQTPVNLDDAGVASFPAVALEPAGDGLAIWQHYDASSVVVVARSLSSGGWGTPTSLSLADSDFLPVPPPARAAVSPLGNAAAVWALSRDSAYEVWADTLDPTTNQWGTAIKLSPATSTISAIATGLDASGNGFALWFDTATGNARTIYADRILQTGGLTKVLTLSTDTTPAIASNPQLALDSQGRALAIWDTQAPTQYEVWASRFE